MGQLGSQFDLLKNNPLFRDLQEHIVANFWKYHQQNPSVYELFKRFAGELKKAGRVRYGAGAIIERIRWHFAVETTGDEFKLNNNYRSCYARLLMIEDKNFENFFKIRTSLGYVPPATLESQNARADE